jgi:hypothetical protein
MTLVKSDTFESYPAGTALPPPWTNTGSTVASSAQAHGGTISLAIGVGGNASTSVLPLGVSLNSWTLDVWLWVNAVGATTNQFVGCRPSGGGGAGVAGIVLSIGQTGAGQVYVPGFSPFFTFTTTTGVWHHCILTVVQDAAAGSIALTVDGTSVGTFSGDTTRGGGGGVNVGEFVAVGGFIGPSPPAEFYVDDLFIYNNAGAPYRLRSVSAQAP